MKEILPEISDLGVKATAFLAGFVGSLVSLVHEKNLTFGRSVILVSVGSVCAGFITPLLKLYLGSSSNVENSLAFIVGLIGMRLTRAILDKFETYVKKYV